MTFTHTVTTRKRKEIVDITDQVNDLLIAHEFVAGLCHLFCSHTTAALTAADLDPGTDLDMLDAFQAMVPKLDYRHPHNPAHAPDHIMAALIGPDLTVPVRNGRLVLGTWQRVILVELDGARQRQVEVTLIKT